MNMETANGNNYQDVDSTKIKEVLASIDSQNDFAILSNKDDYLQCAYSAEGFYMEYQNNSGHFEWKSGQAAHKEMEEIFIHYFNNNGEIENSSGWVETANAENTRDNHKQGTSHSSGSFVDQIKSEAKRGIKRAVNKKTSGIIRNVLNKFLD